MSFGGAGLVLAGMAAGGNGGRAKWLIAAGPCFPVKPKARAAAVYLGAWIVLLVVAIDGPVPIGAMADASAAVQVEGLNYFADTLLSGGAILSLAGAATPAPRAEAAEPRGGEGAGPRRRL